MNAKIEISKARPYHRRQPVARFFNIGTMKVGGVSRTIWGFMTFFVPVAKMPIFARFAGLAPVDSLGNLHLDRLEEGDIVVDPGLIYKPIPPLDVTGKMMEEHVKAMKTFRPKDLLVTERDTTKPAVDMGVINLTGKGTKP